MTPIRFLILPALLVALCAPAAAITTAVAPGAAQVPAGHVQQGVIELVVPGSTLKISGRAYVYSSVVSLVHDRHGKRITSPRLAVGQTVRFTVSEDGSQLRIKELWMAD
jgi:hypothetical protein